MKVAIIGGGAAGFFAAIKAKEGKPDAEITIYEKAPKVLSKVKISGGGRCNLTNAERSISELIKAYPRGGKQLKKAFNKFNTKHSYEWFESRGVPLVIQEDGCVFPQSQDSQSIIDCFINECKRLDIKIKVNHSVSAIQNKAKKFEIQFDNWAPIQADKIIITTGGSPQRNGLKWLEDLGHTIEDPVPSLFTFNMPNENIKQLMGIVVEKAKLALQGTKIKSEGPLLITHWGMSGPAVLKLSSFAARILSEKNYNFSIQVNWIGEQNNEIVLANLNNIIIKHGQKQILNYRPYDLPDRLWQFLIQKCDFANNKKWSELGKKGLNKLTNILTNDIYSVKGKTTFREEFVTCGGISLHDIDMNTMQSKICKNLYFAGEVLDIDAITGGFNLQAAWTSGFIAGHLND